MRLLASRFRCLPFRIRHSEGRCHMFPQGASKANELPFLRGDTMMALFVNPCQYSTYVDPPLRKGPSRKKRFCETNLTMGAIGKMGNLPLARPRSATKRTIAPAKSMGSYLRRSTLLAAKFRGNGHKGQDRSLRPGASQEGWRKTPRVASPARRNGPHGRIPMYIGTHAPTNGMHPLRPPRHGPPTNPPGTRLVAWLQ